MKFLSVALSSAQCGFSLRAQKHTRETRKYFCEHGLGGKSGLPEVPTPERNLNMSNETTVTVERGAVK
jgi:hypothetical protein